MTDDIFYIGENLIKQRHAGSKARSDVESIFDGRYKQVFEIKQQAFTGYFDKAIFLLSLDSLSTIHKLLSSFPHAPIIIQYPSYYNRIYNWLIENFIWHHKSVLFVHDIETLRYRDEHAIRREISLMNSTKAIILHNHKMTEELRHHGLIVPVVELGLFDYIINKEIPKFDRKLGNRIVFAGNLGKSKFLTKIPTSSLHLQFDLYGINCPDKLIYDKSIFYHGSFDADDLPYHLEGNFGLVWDGSSLDTCDGPLGHYLKFNNPHKLSLYLASGLPVIVWSQSAMAEFVQNENVGIVVESLHQVRPFINQLSNGDYLKMLSNVRNIQQKLINGYFTNQALNKLEKILLS